MNYSGIAAIGIFCAILQCQTAQADSATGFSISPHQPIGDDERIVSLRITLEQGAFTSFTGIPDGWMFDLSNDAYGKTYLSGDISVGAAALYRNDLLHIGICVHPKQYRDGKLSLSGEIVVTNDFKKTRTFHLNDRDFSPTTCGS